MAGRRPSWIGLTQFFDSVYDGRRWTQSECNSPLVLRTKWAKNGRHSAILDRNTPVIELIPRFSHHNNFHQVWWESVHKHGREWEKCPLLGWLLCSYHGNQLKTWAPSSYVIMASLVKQWYYDLFQFSDMSLPPGDQTEINMTEMLYPDRFHDLPQVFNSLCM